MSGFTIEPGIPAPVGKSSYPWREMNPGDSFLVDEARRKNASSSGNYFLKKTEQQGFLRITSQQREEDPEGMVRVWLVERPQVEDES